MVMSVCSGVCSCVYMWSKKSTCFVLSHSKKLAVCIILLDRGIKGSCRKLDQWKICCNLRFSFLGDCLLFCRDNSIPLLFSHPYQHHPQVLVPWLMSLFYNTLEYVQSFPSISDSLPSSPSSIFTPQPFSPFALCPALFFWCFHVHNQMQRSNYEKDATLQSGSQNNSIQQATWKELPFKQCTRTSFF